MFGADVLPFLLVALVVVVTPGPDMALIAKHTISCGRGVGLAAGAGVCSGLFVHAAAAAMGLSAIVATSSVAFSVVKVVGAGYLLFLGATSVWNVLRRNKNAQVQVADVKSVSPAVAFRQGALTNVLNPKVAVLFLSLLPQFVDPSRDVVKQTIALSTVFIVVGFVWLSTFVYFVSILGARVLVPRIQRRLEMSAGVVFVALAFRLLATDR